MAIAFRNPIEDVPAIKATADLELFPEEPDGLKRPLQLPSPSLVFRDLEVKDEILGYTAVISDDSGPALTAGMHTACSVTFLGVPVEKVWPGRRFALWMGRDVAHATILAAEVAQ
jgi:hypothetical protein